MSEMLTNSKSMSMSMNVNDFNASVQISEQLERMMLNTAQELAIRALTECAERYNFDADEAIRSLGLNYVKMERKSSSKVVAKAKATPVPKPAFPLPYNGEFNENSCFALRQNNGLYTQCQAIRKGDKQFCKACQALADKSEDNVPEYGTIQQRQASDIFLYKDPKGREPVAYTKVMKKFKVSREQVLEEAGKFNIEIHDMHFVEPETETKRGRPKTAKEPKEPKGAKGRPKKAKKVLEIEGETEDLFASLVANAQNNYESDEEVADDEEEEIIMEAVAAPATKKGKTEEEKEQERIAKEAKKQQEEEAKAAKALKKQQEEQAKAEKKALEELIRLDKEQKRLQEKAEKEAKKAAEEQAKALKKQQEEEAKALKKQQEEEAKAAKALKKQQEDEAKAAKASKKQPEKAAKAADEGAEQEPDVVRKIEENGKKYLKSKKTGIIYDYAEYTQNGEQVVVGQWNEKKNAIDFKNDEESEEEYESDDE